MHNPEPKSTDKAALLGYVPLVDVMKPDQDEFTDSTDWLPTPLAALAPLDSSLRCQVCKDFFTTPMITSCSHTFCSLCIRRYLSQEGRCPACRDSDQEIKLRRNWVVEELVANFSSSRKGLLAYATAAAVEKRDVDGVDERPKKRRRMLENRANGIERRSTRSQSKKTTSEASQQSAPSTQEVVDDSEEGSVYEDSEFKSPPLVNGKTDPNNGLVACPCCQRRMKETLINSHLDKCIAGDSHTPVDDASSPAPQNAQITPPGTIAYAQRNPSKQNDRLPFINYTLLNDNSLRKKLRDLGIPNHGSKDLMRRRHTEWVNLWNANCDSTNPISKRQLLQELRVWEDTLGRQGDKAVTAGFMAKDFDRDRHVKTQKTNFDNLIKQARQKKATSADTAGLSTENTKPPPPDGAAPTEKTSDTEPSLQHTMSPSSEPVKIVSFQAMTHSKNTPILGSARDAEMHHHHYHHHQPVNGHPPGASPNMASSQSPLEYPSSQSALPPGRDAGPHPPYAL